MDSISPWNESPLNDELLYHEKPVGAIKESILCCEKIENVV